MPDSNRHRIVAYLGIGAALGFAVAAPVLETANQQRREREQREQQTSSSNDEAGRHFSLLSEVDQTASTDARERAREEREKSDLDAQWATARWTFAQFIVGVLSFLGLAATVYFAFRAYRESKRSADAAQQTLWADRAWMAFELLQVDDLTNSVIDGKPVEKAMRFAVLWKNCGRSPAIGDTVFIDYKIVPHDSPVPTFKPRTATEHEKAGHVVGPGKAINAPHFALEQAKIQRIEDEVDDLYVYSRVSYFDVFQPQTLRWTELCVQVEFNGRSIEKDGSTRPIVGLRFRPPQNGQG
jgi:hypothetical protein